MGNIIHQKDGKPMIQMYHKSVPYFKDKNNNAIVSVYHKSKIVRDANKGYLSEILINQNDISDCSKIITLKE